jgi:hypothetical protein
MSMLIITEQQDLHSKGTGGAARSCGGGGGTGRVADFGETACSGNVRSRRSLVG